MSTYGVDHPRRTAPAWSAVLHAVQGFAPGLIGWPWLVSADDPAWNTDSLVAAAALAAVGTSTWWLRRARAGKRWQAAMERYAELDLSQAWSEVRIA